MTIDLYLAHETEKAYGFKKEQRKTANEKTENLIWCPKSQVKMLKSEDSDEGFFPLCTIELADWIAEKNELAPSTKKASDKTVKKTVVTPAVQSYANDDEDDDIPF